jgi:hypothetical protein
MSRDGKTARVKLAREIRASLARYNDLQLPDLRAHVPDWEDISWDHLCTAREKLTELIEAEIIAREAREALDA